MGETDSLLRDYLALHHAFCPRCRYELHGLADARCPECGRLLTLEEVADPDNVPLSLAWWACYVPLVLIGVIGVMGAFATLGATLQVLGKFWRAESIGIVDVLWPVLFAPSLAFLTLEHRWARDGHSSARWPESRLRARAVMHWLGLVLVVISAWAGAVMLVQAAE